MLYGVILPDGKSFDPHTSLAGISSEYPRCKKMFSVQPGAITVEQLSARSKVLPADFPLHHLEAFPRPLHQNGPLVVILILGRSRTV